MSNETNKGQESVMSFIDYGNWKKNQEIMTVLIDRSGGRQSAVGHIYFGFDRSANKPIYRAYDSAGKELFPPNHSLAQLKRQFTHSESRFVEALEKEEKAHPGDRLEELTTKLAAPTTAEIPTPHKPVVSPYAEPKKKKAATRALQAIRTRKADKEKTKSITR